MAGYGTPLEDVKSKKKKVVKSKAVTKPLVVEEDTFLTRLVKEKADLDDRIKGLFIFTRGPMENVLPEAKVLLVKQLAVMSELSDLIKQRLVLLK
jgi:hypothetical protein